MVEGSRIRSAPSVALPMRKAYGFLVPKVGLETIRYSLDGEGESVSVSAPVFRVDGGLFLQREVRKGRYVQSLEPRLVYLKIPPRRQPNRQGVGGFPNFDTRVARLNNFSEIFRDNRFFGGDRIGDTEQVALGVTSRVLAKESGAERLRFGVGEIYYLREREVGLEEEGGGDGVVADDAARSGVVAEVSAEVARGWRMRGFAKLGNRAVRRDEVSAFRLLAEYNGGKLGGADATVAAVSANSTTAQFGYIFHQSDADGNQARSDAENLADSEEIRFAWEGALGGRWWMDSAVHYSLMSDALRSARVGFKVDGCCWTFEFGARRDLTDTREYRNSIMLTLLFEGLGRGNEGGGGGGGVR